MTATLSPGKFANCAARVLYRDNVSRTTAFLRMPRVSLNVQVKNLTYAPIFTDTNGRRKRVLAEISIRLNHLG